MSKYLLFYSDVHIREYGSFTPYNHLDSNGLTKELNNILKGFDFVADMIRKYKPIHVGLLGDIYNTTEMQTARVLQASAWALGKTKAACDELGIGQTILDGNHDLLSESPRISNIANLIGYGTVVHEPYHLDLGGFRLGFVPASDNHGVMFSNLQMIQSSVDLICTHTDFAGCKYESGHPSASPIPAQWDKPVVSGDIHLPQSLGNVHYIGSLIQNKFYRNPIENVGGVLLYDIENGAVLRVKNTYSKHYIKHFEGSGEKLPPPESCVLMVVSSKSKDEITEMFKDYEHIHIPAIVQRDAVKVTYSHFSLDNPDKILRSHVAKDRPEAIDTFDEVMSKT